jgi:DNA-binding MarR family transcriptional regulator
MLPVFLPPLEMQEKFFHVVDQIRSLLVTQKQTAAEIDRLSRSALINAFTGQLTRNYREQNLVELTRLADERDLALSHPSLVEQPDETEPVYTRSIIDLSLSPSQRDLLTFIEEQNSYITNEKLDVGSNLSPNEIRRNLDLLAWLGLIKVAQIAVTPGELGRVFFTKIYRALRPEDDVRETDLAILSEAQAG